MFYITTIIVRHSTRTSRSLSTGLSTLGREAVERVAGREVVVRAAAKVVEIYNRGGGRRRLVSRATAADSPGRCAAARGSGGRFQNQAF